MNEDGSQDRPFCSERYNNTILQGISLRGVRDSPAWLSVGMIVGTSVSLGFVRGQFPVITQARIEHDAVSRKVG